MTLPPEPSRERWQPLRGGLLNLYLYDRQELVYEDGRLLLRGNNGTGKSRILALQLPFLLDGEIAPQRVEPDGDPSKRIEWHLLMDGRYPDRVGYTWLELGRRDADGVAHYRTIGCGMKAVQGKGAPTRWLFLTDQRIGIDIELENAARAPLGRRRLEEVIGDRGRVYDRAAEYRAALDQLFFQLGDRYGALIDLLIQLRRPQLSRKLDADALSNALSEALPPLSDGVLGDVSEAFRGLEADRGALEGHRAALEATDTFLQSYRRYVQLATRRRADALRTTHASYENTTRRLRDAEQVASDAARRVEVLAAGIESTEDDAAAAEAAVRALDTDPAQRDARTLDEARQAHERADAEARRARTEAERRDADLERARDGERRARSALEERERAVTDSRARCMAVATQGGCETLLDGFERAVVEARLAERARHVQHLATLVGAVRAAERVLAEARRLCSREQAELDRAQERRDHCVTSRDAERDALQGAVTAWAESLEILDRPDVDLLREAVADFAESGHGSGPIAPLVAELYASAVALLADDRARTQAALDAISRDLTEARAEHDRLAQGEQRAPAAPAWRDAVARTGRLGAPLWSLCDFRDDIADDARAAVEAALDASGLLDAWVLPDGAVLAEGVLDASLVPTLMPLDAPTLGEVLAPAVDREDPCAREVPDEVVERVLRSIGAAPGAGPVWVAADGRFELGPLRGAAHKPAAEHIGHGARERARRRRLAELAQRTELLAAEEARVRGLLDDVEARTETAARERAAAPSEEKLRGVLAALVAADVALRDRHEQYQVAQRAEQHARERHEAEQRVCEDAARVLGLGAWVDRIDGLTSHMRDLERALHTLWGASELAGQAAIFHASHERALADALQRCNEQRDIAREASRVAASSRSTYETLASALGASIEALQRKMAEARGRLDDLRDRLKDLRRKHESALKEGAAASSRVEELVPLRDSDDTRRRQAMRELQALARTSLLGTLGPDWRGLDVELDWSPTAAVEVARRLDRALRGVEGTDEAWDRESSRLHVRITELTAALLARDLSPSATQDADVLLVTIPYQGRVLTPDLLRENLAEEIASRERILDERERTILENHLVGEVAIHLHQRIREGDRLVVEMNREIESRPLSTGMRLRFLWEPRDSEPELAAARKRLLAAHAVWSPDDRAALGDFLMRRISAERAEAQTGTWREHLEKALDYRRWHHFTIERRQDERWVRLTRRTYGTGSGGEKAIALTLPLLAAAAAHYRSASPHAPRLILMDEAFVGVDSDMRAKCMGLLTAFDLDFVMTSEREWGCYATLPALAIYQLVTRPGLEAVHATRWVWNGRERLRDSGTAAEAESAP